MKKKKIKSLLCFIVPLLILLIISLINMKIAGNYQSMYQSYFFKQTLWFLIGFILLIILKFFPIKLLFKYSKLFYIINVLLLVLVLFFGKTINGSRAWFNFGFFSFQPSELMKFTLSLFLCSQAAIMPNNSIKQEFKFLFKMFIITIIPSLLVFLEPDTGAILIYLLIMLGVILVYKIHKRWYIIFFIGITLLLGGFLALYYFNKDLLIKVMGTSLFYRIDRILSFIKQDSFQLDRALISIGASSFFGSNINLYIPEAPTDFIIAFSISNFGLFGFFVILLCYLSLDFYFLVSLFKMKNTKYKMFLSAFLCMFIFAQIQNIGMNLGLLPIIGLPLPFLSYGGTNTIVYFLFLGVILKFKNNN